MAWHERGGASSKVTAQTRAFTRDLRHHPAYRPDVDGLRALAILPVVLFHAFPTMLRGGFVGVDIFFVISGFLISGIIFKGLHRESFSFPGFYANRIKRIFPALLLVLSACAVFGWFLIIPTLAAGVITLGIAQQTVTALSQVTNSFQYLVNSWSTIVELLSIHKRLKAFEASLPIHREAGSRGPALG